MLDLGTKTPKTRAHLSDLIKLSSEDSYGGGYEPANTRTLVFGDGGLASSVDQEGSGATTPPLWGPESPESRRRNYLALSPRSRTDAIAKGQMELMEMVKNMPEGCFELSLKDLVEVNRGVGQERLLEGQRQNGSYARWAGVRAQRQPRHHQMVRGGSLDGSSGGFLLKMVFPVPWMARKKKKKIGGFDANSGNNGVGSNAVPVKEWWKTRAALSASARGESVESGREPSSINNESRKSSNGSSSSWSSSSNNNSRRQEFDSDCWSFIRTNKSRPLK